MEQNNGPVPINRLSAQEDISTGFLEQIFYNLKKAGIVQSARGPGGGFSFARPLDSISVHEILEASGEELAMVPCAKPDTECGRSCECVSHKVFGSVNEMVSEKLRAITVQALLEDGAR
jgi:Rrf2 family iron-sulfur cluster assembly transcriptional regulator